VTVNIHEYQAKEILSEFGVNVPRGGLAYSPAQAVFRAKEIGANHFLLKAQIHSGARSSVGGIIRCSSDEEIRQAADELMGKRLVTRQTGPDGQVVHRLYIEEMAEVVSECYIGFVLDRQKERVAVVASSDGGMNIEDIYAERPDSLIRLVVEPAVGMQTFQARWIAFKLGIDKSLITQTVTTLLGCYRAFRDLDATLVEVNPLAVTTEGQLMALDAKMVFDDNALFRRERIANLRDKTQEDPLSRKAQERGLNYVRLEGEIGCIVNGAGLAMATLDMIHVAGGKPANFLDIGLSPQSERVNKAINLILSDTKVKVILVNIFAGISRCDWFAEGLIKAMKKYEIKVPVVVRLAGTYAKTGRGMIKESGLPIILAESLRDVAEKAVIAVKVNTG
jgi:succinyl-CoA synthetase beta subunit